MNTAETPKKNEADESLRRGDRVKVYGGAIVHHMRHAFFKGEEGKVVSAMFADEDEYQVKVKDEEYTCHRKQLTLIARGYEHGPNG